MKDANGYNSAELTCLITAQRDSATRMGHALFEAKD